VFEDIRLQEQQFKEQVLSELEVKEKNIAIVEALAMFSDTPGWRVFKERVAEWREAQVRELLSATDPHQKFRLSGKVEALTGLVAAVEDAASEAKRLSAERDEFKDWTGRRLQGEDFRLHPAGGKWQDGEAHGGQGRRQGQGG
jgi:hypothetical protein